MARTLAMFALSSAACASIHTDVKIVDALDSTRHVERVVPGSRTYTATAGVSAGNLVVTVTRADLCEVADVPVIRRRRITTHTELPIGPSRVIWQEYFLGIVAGGVGGLLLYAPERACTSRDSNGTVTQSDPQECEVTGAALASVGAGLLGAGIYDSFRMRDSVEDLGVHDGDYLVSTQVCNTGAAGREAIELVLILAGDAVTVRGTTSDAGTVELALQDVPEDALMTARVQVALGDSRVDLQLLDTQRRELVSALRADPASRIAKDAASRQQTQLAETLAAIRSGNAEQVDALVRRDPAVRDALSRDARVEPLVRKLALDIAFALLSGKPSTDATARWCATRSVYIGVVGETAWRTLVRDFATRGAQIFGGSASAVLDRLEGSCAP